MNSYEQFAEIYDELMQDIPYEQYVQWIVKFAPKNRYPKILDVGCGTGTLAMMFHSEGYEVTGIDISEGMLAVAFNRMQSEGILMPLYAMSMDELEGFSDLDIVTIPIDSINYLRGEQSVFETLKRVYDALRNGGQLFFDVHSLYKMNEVFLQSPFTYDDGELMYVWHTEKADVDYSIYHQLTFFMKDNQSGLYERFDEEHFQRTFPIEQYESWLREIGFSIIEITADFTEDQPNEKSERIFFRAMK